MNQWWLNDLERLNRERLSISDLYQAEPWLLDAEWDLERTDLCVNARIEACGTPYAVRLQYPAYFPAIPPGVWPQERQAPRWSNHQYGAGGELCLEWGPDTWHPEVSGADVLRSAYKLLRTENSVGNGDPVEVPSRHKTTAGQELRWTSFRLAITRKAASYLAGLKETAEASFHVLLHRECIVAVLRAVETDSDNWTDPEIPGALSCVGWSWRALVVPVEELVSTVAPKSLSELREAVSAASVDPLRLDVVDQLGRHRLDGVLFVGDAGEAALVRIIDREKGTVARCETVVMTSSNGRARLADETTSLQKKKVGIVGLGSAGSKIALMLARSGVGKFVLIDDDVFLPENLIRHTLDWRSVCEHKVDGVALQLELVAPCVEVQVERLQVTGQVTTASVDRAVNLLADCDLIVDATACGRTFGLLGSVAARAATALVWTEVFEGGIGGLVGRFRPGRDPEPFLARARVASFLEEQEAPSLKSTGLYAGERAGGEPMVASDADVTAIAAHAARFALDALPGHEPSAFPHSVYLVGLTEEWLFRAPFHTLPIDVGEPDEATKSGGQGGLATAETVEFIKDIVERSIGGRSSPSA